MLGFTLSNKFEELVKAMLNFGLGGGSVIQRYRKKGKKLIKNWKKGEVEELSHLSKS